jgi:hypothetical protein
MLPYKYQFTYFFISMTDNIINQQPTTPQVSGNKRPKGLIIILAIVGILVLITIIGIGVFMLGKKQNKEKSTTSPTTTQSQDGSLSFDNAEVTSDPFNDPNGPFYHKISIASSTDGLSFDKEGEILIEKASVPDAVELPDGRIFLYAVDGGNRSMSGLLVGISDDKGQTWQFGSLKIETARTQRSVGADPEIVLLSDGTFRLYYIVFNMMTPSQTPQDNKVMSATSTDGINFTEEEGVRFEYGNITDPDVVLINGTWYMYLSQGARLIAATSNDGFDFKYSKTIREDGSVSNTVHLDNETWRQFYCSSGIKSAISTDGINWEQDNGYRLEPEKDEFICDPVPIKIDGNWIMIYKVAPATQGVN